MPKCNRDCFHCKYNDCINDTVSKDERFMQNYRDKCATVTGTVMDSHGNRNHHIGGSNNYYRSEPPINNLY